MPLALVVTTNQDWLITGFMLALLLLNLLRRQRHALSGDLHIIHQARSPTLANYGSDGGDSYVLYNSTTGALYYDADGSGSANSAVQFALIGTTTHTALTAADFVVI